MPKTAARGKISTFFRPGAELAEIAGLFPFLEMIGVAPTLEEVGEPTGASASPLIWMTGGVSVASFVGGETWELQD
jgi:hypothetical protein